MAKLKTFTDDEILTAEDLNDAFDAVTVGGVVSVPAIASGANATVAVAFPAGMFPSAPVVVCTPANGRLNVGLSNLSASGVTLTFFNWTSSGAGATTAHWTATPA